MRLTLRSLLGYLDDILEPKDAEDLSKKIAESSVATNLLHRIRDVTKRLRLGAPNVLDRGAGLDPNTVAEYLDHSLPPGQVPDFEKVCLESDVQLAEVASCHQILAMVLGEPAEVDPDSRQRIYQLPDLVAESGAPVAVPEEPAVAARPAATTVTELPSITKPEPPAARPPVPEYVAPAASPSQRWKTVVSLAVVLMVAVGLLWVGGLFRSDRSGEELSQGTPSGEGPTLPAVQGPIEPAAAAPSIPPPGAFPEGKPATKPAVAAEGVEEPAPKTGLVPRSPEVPPARPRPTPGSVAREPSGPEPPRRPVEAQGSEPRPQPPGNVEGPAIPPPPKAPAEVALPPPQPVGQVTTAKEVLLRLDPQSAAWYRLADRAVVGSYDKLLSLPTFRPVVVLAGKVQMELVDGTLVQFLPVESSRVVSVLLEHGRLVFKADEAGRRVRLEVADRTGVLTFDEAASVVAVEAVRLEGPGDPETRPGPMVANAYVVSGKVAWQEEPQGKRLSLAGPDRLALGVAGLDSHSPRQVPRWVTDDTVGSLEKRAALVVERSIVPDRLAGDGLIELTKRPQREVRWLALRSAALAGEFKPLLDGLSSPEQKLLWPDYVELLRSAVIRGPQSAAAVRTAMEKAYGPEGAGLYEMLWRYRADTLRGKEAAQLVGYLDHEELIFRVLSSWNLKNIKGVSLSYRPDDPYSKRQLAVQRWRDRLRSDPALRGKVPPVEDRARNPAPSPPAGEEPRSGTEAQPKELPPDGGNKTIPPKQPGRDAPVPPKS